MPRFHYFPTFSAEPERRESLRLAFPFSLNLVLALCIGKACLPYIPTFSVDPKHRESLRLAFTISLHLELNLNVRKVFPMPSLFPYTFSAQPEYKESLRHAFPISLHLVPTLNEGKKILWGNTSLFLYVPFSLQLGLPVFHKKSQLIYVN